MMFGEFYTFFQKLLIFTKLSYFCRPFFKPLSLRVAVTNKVKRTYYMTYKQTSSK